MRFLLSRRWALFAVTVVVLAYGCYWLGQWQFHRLHARETTNAQTRANLAGDPTPVADVLAPGREARTADEWRRVTATGRYLPGQNVVIRYQTRDGGSGVDVVTPLRTTTGPLLLVDRGWLQTDNVGADQVEAPAPPAGTVTVVGWVRVDATGDAATVTDGSARAISSVQIAQSLPRTLDAPVYGGFVDAERETPPPATPLVHAEQPDLGNGPHFFYGLQWWFFGLLAVFGFGYLAYDERRKLRAPPQPASSQPAGSEPAGSEPAGSEPAGSEPAGSEPAGSELEGAERPAVDREHRAADEARSG